MNALTKANHILEHPLFKIEYDRLTLMEKDRIFCRHTMEHFLDVARAGWIMILEAHLDISKDVMYAAGLLHDIGKGRQYAFGTPHNEAGADIAKQILTDTGYTEDEIDCICTAIRLHRKPTADELNLSSVLYAADKKTRLCFSCPAESECNWSPEKKNMKISY